MAFGDWIDGAIAPLAPGWAASRIAARARVEAASAARDGVRQYSAAAHDRRTNGWNRSTSSVDRENGAARSLLAGAAHDLVRNDKYAAAGVRQMVATIWGDGISAQASHPVKRVQQAAQDAHDRWAESKVDGFGDWYGHGKLAVREMIVGGEAMTLWRPSGDEPNARVFGMEGAQLDGNKTLRLTGGGKVVQGVQFDASGERSGYWLYGEHPNDAILGGGLLPSLVPAQYVDHMFERQRLRQTRGVSWLGAVAMTLRDVSDIEDAKRLQAKVQACLALVIQPGEGAEASPLGEQKALDERGGSPIGETVRPGMVARLNSGETVSVVNPTPSADQVDFIRQQVAAVSANMVPYHLMTGDVSQANYSGLRAAMNGSYALVDDWQQNEVIPLLCRPMVRRRMEVLAMQRNDRRFLDVKWNFALPVRRLVDPIKDLMGEIMEIRSGLKLISKGLAERGINAEEHMRDLARMNTLIDELGLALDSDPRRVTDSGVLQAAAGYIAPKGAQQGD